MVNDRVHLHRANGNRIPGGWDAAVWGAMESASGLVFPECLDHPIDFDAGPALYLIGGRDGLSKVRFVEGCERRRGIPKVEPCVVPGIGILEIVLLLQTGKSSELRRSSLDYGGDLILRKVGFESDEQDQLGMVHGHVILSLVGRFVRQSISTADLPCAAVRELTDGYSFDPSALRRVVEPRFVSLGFLPGQH